MKRNIKRLVSTAVVSMMALQLTGCGTTEAAKLPSVNFVTKQELVDYYAKEIANKSAITRTNKVYETYYELYEVTKEEQSKAEEFTDEIISDLSNSTYGGDSILDINTYYYIKSILNDVKLSNISYSDVKQSLGYYFVTAKFDIAREEQGELNDYSKLVGLSGAFKLADGISNTVDDSYLAGLANTASEYLLKNGFNFYIKYEAGKFSASLGKYVESTDSSKGTGSNKSDTSDVDIQDIKDSVDSTLNTKITQRDIDELAKLGLDSSCSDIKYTDDSYKGLVITTNKFVKYIEENVGTTSSDTPSVPELSIIYKYSSLTLSGFGLYQSGVSGINKISESKEPEVKGTAELKFIIKFNSKGELSLYNAYVSNITKDTKELDSYAKTDVIVPEYLKTNLSELVDRLDRVYVDDDIYGMEYGDLLLDNSYGIMVGTLQNYSNVASRVSTLDSVVYRDTTKNQYMLKVTTRQTDGSKGAKSCGTFIDTYYIVVSGIEDKLYITDIILGSRETDKSPDIESETSSVLRLTELGLTGEISDSTKEEVTKVLNTLYDSCENRDITGVTNSFNSDTSMLSSTELDYNISKLKNVVGKYGDSLAIKVNGIVSSFIGGSTNQVELTTEELTQYKGKDAGTYEKVYYLMSKFTGKWVIDQRTVISESELSGSDLSGAVDRIEK